MGKVVAVTGAAGGIGTAAVRRFADVGAAVAAIESAIFPDPWSRKAFAATLAMSVFFTSSAAPKKRSAGTRPSSDWCDL